MRDKETRNLYRTWCNMIQRCTNPNNDSYKNYGERGITVCERWTISRPRGQAFKNFVSDMRPRPFKMTLERIDTNGNYEPSNCRWATKKEQARNTRKRRIVMFQGVEYHVAALAEKLGIDVKTIYYRIKRGWSDERISDPSAQYNNSESQAKAVAKHAEMWRAKTHCKRGHEFTPENTYVHSNHRYCKECRRAWDRAIYHGVKPA